MLAATLQPSMHQPGVSLADAAGYLLQSSIATFIRSQFASGEQGAWYDNSDLSTMFADATGFTPATVNSGVALQLDKRVPLTTGVELTTAGGFSTGVGWSLERATISGGALNIVAAANGAGSYQTSANYNVGYYEITLVVSAISAGAVTATLGIGSPSALNALNITAPGTYTFRQANYSADTYLRVYSVGASTTATVDSVSVKLLSGNHRYQLTAANEPILRLDASGRYYLDYNGTSRSLQTRAINFTGTDKMTVVSGLRVVGTGNGALVDFGNRANNSFEVGSLANASPHVYGGVRGPAGVASSRYVIGTVPANTQNAVHSWLFDLAGATVSDEVNIRVDGVLKSAITNDAGPSGAGAFGNYTMTFGNGALGFFNGREYQTVIRGAATATASLARLERITGQKSGVTL